MTAEKAYQLYFALRLHFTTSYDVFVSGTNFKGKNEVKSRKGFGLINGLMRHTKTEREFVELCVANNLYDNQDFIYDVDSAYENYKHWSQVKSSLDYTLESNLGQIEISLLSRKMTIDQYMQQHVLNDLLSRRIEYETIILLNHRIECIDKIQGFDSSKYRVRMHKATKFVNKGAIGHIQNCHIDNFLATFKGNTNGNISV